MIPPDARAEVIELIDLVRVQGSCMIDRAFRVVCALTQTPLITSDPEDLAKPGAEAEARLGTVRLAQRSVAGVAQTLGQLHSVVQQHAIAVAVAVEDGEDAAAAVQSVLWHQLREVAKDMGALTDRLIGITLTAGGPGPIDLPGEVPRVPGLAELLACYQAGADDDGEAGA